MAAKTRRRDAESGVMRGVDYSDALMVYRATKVADISRALRPRTEKKPAEPEPFFLKDVFSGFYVTVPLVDSRRPQNLSDLEYYQLILQSVKSKEFKDLRNGTVAKSQESAIAAAVFVNAIMDNLKKMSEDGSNPQQQQIAQDLMRKLAGEGQGQQAGSGRAGRGTGQGQAGPSQGQQPGQGNGTTQEQIEEAIEKLLSGALGETKEKMDDGQTVQGNMGVQAGIGHDLSRSMDWERVMRLANSTDLKDLLRLLNGLPDFSSLQKRRYKQFDYGEINGVDFGYNVERAIPSEFASGDLLPVKMFDGNIATYKRRINQDRSSIFVLTDKSGSMGTGATDKITWARALTIALMGMARSSGRNFFYTFFDDHPFASVDVLRGAKRRDVANAAIDIATTSGTGGTNITRAVAVAASKLSEEKKRYKDLNDIILITDGEDAVDVGKVREALDGSNAELISIVLSNTNHQLKELSRFYIEINKLSREELARILELVQREQQKNDRKTA